MHECAGHACRPSSLLGKPDASDGSLPHLPLGFFRGLAPGLIGIIPARSVYFMAYSKMKEFLARDGGLGDNHRDLTEIVCGLTAGVVQNTITNPIWMVKTRMQVRHRSFSDARVIRSLSYMT